MILKNIFTKTIEQMKKEHKTAIFMALGEASMCWSEIPKGIFDSEKCERIGNELINKLKQ